MQLLLPIAYCVEKGRDKREVTLSWHGTTWDTKSMPDLLNYIVGPKFTGGYK
jgi:hypothetical protein